MVLIIYHLNLIGPWDQLSDVSCLYPGCLEPCTVGECQVCMSGREEEDGSDEKQRPVSPQPRNRQEAGGAQM